MNLLDFYDFSGPWNEPDHSYAHKARWVHHYLMRGLPLGWGTAH